ncbi:MAG: hypothetical protein ACI9KE_002231 [Polyangiales bacterium]|jgi:hypothetical protein
MARVRSSVAQRQLGKDLYAMLAQDPEADVRLALAQNPGTPRSILEKLARDFSRKVRKCAAERLES